MFSIGPSDNSEAVFVSLNCRCTVSEFPQESVAQSSSWLAYAELTEVINEMLDDS